MLHLGFSPPIMYRKSLCANAHAQAGEEDAFMERVAGKRNA